MRGLDAAQASLALARLTSAWLRRSTSASWLVAWSMMACALASRALAAISA
jgi:hypothetical protein